MVGDLRLLCANCHRMVHAKRPWLTMEELAAVLHRARGLGPENL
jgi:5-methylcytosine-specific restriction protein A